MEGVRRRARRGQLDGALTELEQRCAKGDFEEVAKAGNSLLVALVRADAEAPGSTEGLAERLAAVRGRALKARLTAGEAKLKALHDRKDYAAVGAAGRRLEAELRPEAEALGQAGEVIGPLRKARAGALTARCEEVCAELEGLIARNELTKVATRGSGAALNLSVEAAALDDLQPLAKVREVRRKALLLRGAQARRLLEALLARGALDRVGVAGVEALRELGDEARATGELEKLTESLRGARREALRARLAAVQKEALALVGQERYHAVDRLAESAEKQLRAEADAVGEGERLTKFRRFCADVSLLARAAKKADPD
jgi:hypothetical protein